MKEQSRKQIVWIFFVLSLGWMGLIFFFSAQPAIKSAELSTKTVDWLLSPSPKGSILQHLIQKLQALDGKGILEFLVRKLAHAVEYGVLAVLLGITIRFSRRWNQKWQIKTIILCWLYACTDEFHQLFVPGRAGQVRDVIIDTVGAIFAVLVIWLFFIFLERKRQYF